MPRRITSSRMVSPGGRMMRLTPWTIPPDRASKSGTVTLARLTYKSAFVSWEVSEIQTSGSSLHNEFLTPCTEVEGMPGSEREIRKRWGELSSPTESKRVLMTNSSCSLEEL